MAESQASNQDGVAGCEFTVNVAGLLVTQHEEEHITIVYLPASGDPTLVKVSTAEVRPDRFKPFRRH